MGSPGIEDWAAAVAEKGPIYMGAEAGSQMPLVWLLVSIALCVIAVWFGSAHELRAYKKMEK